MKKIAIFGAGGFGREVAMLIEHINQKENNWEIIGFFDDSLQPGTMVNQYTVLGGMEKLNSVEEETFVVLAIGQPETKKKILSKINNVQIKYPVLIHPNVFMGYSVEIGEGSIITAGNILTVNITIGKHVILNLACTVGHDAIIGNFSSFMPSVNISGETNIGDCVYVGTGTKINNLLEIGSNTIVGAGAVVTKTLPANCTAVGIPAKPIKFNQ